MDIPRGKAHKRRRTIFRVLWSIVALAGIGGITWYLSQLEPAAPSVDRGTMWMDKVRRADLEVKVRGPGTLVPEEELYIPALTSGRIERILVKPGVSVVPDTIILKLTNPELERDALDARLQLEAMEARFQETQIQQRSALMNQRAQAESIKAQFSEAKLEADSNEQLQGEGLIDDLTYERSRIRAENLDLRNDLEQERLKIAKDAVDAMLAAARADIEKQQALYGLRQEQLASLSVRAGISGQLQEVTVEEGQQVSPGSNLARVARPEKLMAELRIPETQANEVVVNQYAEIDTRNGIIPGHVIRVDPAAQQGQVQVDVALDGPLPQGARPQLSVDGTIRIEKLSDVLVMGRPAYGQADSTIGLFKLAEDGIHAVRAQIKLGRSSVNEIEVKTGLREGDQVILSDTSQWDQYDRIRLIN